MTERAAYWRRVLRDWEQSGLSQAKFCRRRGLAAVDHFAYLCDVLLRIHTHPAERISELILIPREWKTRFGPALPAPAQSAA